MNDELITPDRFWELIESSLEEAGGDPDGQLEVLAEALADLTSDERASFQSQLHRRFDEAYTWDLWAAAYIVNEGCSDDGFLFFRAWLVAQGHDVFESAVDDPNSLIELDFDVGDCELESLLNLAAEVEEECGTGELEVAGYLTPLESDPEGEPWTGTAEALAERLPGLWAAHGWE